MLKIIKAKKDSFFNESPYYPKAYENVRTGEIVLFCGLTSGIVLKEYRFDFPTGTFYTKFRPHTDSDWIPVNVYIEGRIGESKHNYGIELFQNTKTGSLILFNSTMSGLVVAEGYIDENLQVGDFLQQLIPNFKKQHWIQSVYKFTHETENINMIN